MRGSSLFQKGFPTASLRRRQESRFHIFIPSASKDACPIARSLREESWLILSTGMVIATIAHPCCFPVGARHVVPASCSAGFQPAPLFSRHSFALRKPERPLPSPSRYTRPSNMPKPRLSPASSLTKPSAKPTPCMTVPSTAAC